MSVPKICWWLLLLTMVLALMAADQMERAGERRGVAACLIVLVVAAVTAIALACAQHGALEFHGDVYSEEFEEFIQSTREVVAWSTRPR